MFKELMPIIEDRPLTITVSAEGNGSRSVSISFQS
jgi:hypothetical protein